MIVGVLGGGQLGRMLALAGIPLGLRFRFLDPNPDCPAAEVGELIVGAYDDEQALARLVRGVEAVTYEFENVPATTAAWLEAHAPVHPSSRSLAVSQDRVAEKELFNRLGIATAPFARVDTRAQLDSAIAQIGLPAILKTRRMGYDGKGQCIIRTMPDADAAWRELGGRAFDHAEQTDRADLVLEGFVPFVREVSVIGARDRDGKVAFFPPVQNRHERGILARTDAPAPGLKAEKAAEYLDAHRRVLEALVHVGVLAIEFFELPDGRIVANEMAPRVHNSGHWTIEGAFTSQFENHLRAVLGLPLGSASAIGASVMLNIIGKEPDAAAVLAIPDTHLHLYGKSPRPGRKLGHITVRGSDAREADARAATAAACLRNC